MRREFIMMLLGIIFISSLSSYLSGNAQIEAEIVLLDTVSGSVGAGNFSYWQSGHTGPIIVELLTIAGDADIYVSDNIRPGYEVDRNNFSSITCGADIIEVPAEFPRPVGIAVFGHWSHHISTYSLQVYQDAAVFMRAGGTVQLDWGPEEKKKVAVPDRSRVKSPKKEEESGAGFLGLFTILDVFFDLFIF